MGPPREKKSLISRPGQSILISKSNLVVLSSVLQLLLLQLLCAFLQTALLRSDEDSVSSVFVGSSSRHHQLVLFATAQRSTDEEGLRKQSPDEEVVRKSSGTRRSTADPFREGEEGGVATTPGGLPALGEAAAEKIHHAGGGGKHSNINSRTSFSLGTTSAFEDEEPEKSDEPNNFSSSISETAAHRRLSLAQGNLRLLECVGMPEWDELWRALQTADGFGGIEAVNRAFALYQRITEDLDVFEPVLRESYDSSEESASGGGINDEGASNGEKGARASSSKGGALYHVMQPSTSSVSPDHPKNNSPEDGNLLQRTTPQYSSQLNYRTDIHGVNDNFGLFMRRTQAYFNTLFARAQDLLLAGDDSTISISNYNYAGGEAEGAPGGENISTDESSNSFPASKHQWDRHP